MKSTRLSRLDTKACCDGQDRTSNLGLTTEIFDTERDGETVVVSPRADLRQLSYPHIAAGGREVLRALSSGAVQNVVVDFRNTDRCGSTALGFLIFLWKKVRACGGKMAVCNVTDHALERLRMMNLDRLWLVCASQKEALGLVRRRLPSTACSDN